MHVCTPANSRAIGRNELGGGGGRVKAVQKEFGEVVVVVGRRPSVYSASIPRALQLIMQRRPSSVCRHSSQSAPGGAQRHAGNTSTHKHTQAVLVKNTQALNHERCNGWGEGGRVSLSPFVQGGGILGGMGGVRGVAAG